MINEAQAVALMNEANPVPDLEGYRVSEADVAAYLDILEQRSSAMTQLDTKKKDRSEGRPPRRRLLIGAAAAAVVLLVGTIAVTTSDLLARDSSIPLMGAEGDPAAMEAFEAVEAAYDAFNTGDGETWVEARERGLVFQSSRVRDLHFDTELINYEAAAAVDEHVEVLQCVSNGNGVWADFAREAGDPLDPAESPVSRAENPTGYLFVCDTIHSNEFHTLAGIDLALTYEWVVDDGAIVASFTKGPGLTDPRQSQFEFTSDFGAWLSKNHEDVYWELPMLFTHPYPHPDSGPRAIEYAKMFVDESPDWPINTGS